MDSKSSRARRPNNGHGNSHTRRTTTSSRDAARPISQHSSRTAPSSSARDAQGESDQEDDDDAMDVDPPPKPKKQTKETSGNAVKPAVRTPSLSPPAADGSANGSSNGSKTRSAASALAASLTPTAKALLDGFSKLASPKPCSSPRILPNCDPLPSSTASALASLVSGSSTFTQNASAGSSHTEQVELDLVALPGDSLVHAAIEARLPITAMSDLETRTFGKHFSSPPDKLATYLDVRNRILRAFFLTPQRALTLHEAIRACRGHRLDLVGAVYQFLVRNSMINFGVVRPPGMSGGVLVSSSSDPPPPATLGPRAPETPSVRPRRFVVIGAGAAGLACARQLKQLSEAIAFSATLDPSSNSAQVTRTIPPPEVIVLEARNRVGGRVYTHPLYTKVRTSQSPFASTYTTGVDLGAKVVTGWDGGNPIKTIVRGQLRLNTHELNRPTRMFDSHGDEVDSSVDELVEEVFNEVLEETTRMREEMKASSKRGARAAKGRGRGGQTQATDGSLPSDREGASGSPRPTSGREPRTCSAAACSETVRVSGSGAESSATSSRASSRRRGSRKAAAASTSPSLSTSVNTSDQESNTNTNTVGSDPLASGRKSDSSGDDSSSSDDDEARDDGDIDQSDNESRFTGSRRSSSSANRPVRSFSVPKLSTMSLGDAIEQALKDHAQFQSFSDKETELLHWHLANLEFANSCTVDQSSLEHWDQDDEHELLGPHGMIIGGYGQVTHALAYGCRAMAVQTGTEADGIATDALDLRLNTPVKHIKWNKVHKSRLRSLSRLADGNNSNKSTDPAESSNVEVVCADGTRIPADAVIVTAPLGVLKSNSIQFSPELPKQKQSSIQRLGFGTLNKVVLVFKSAFWDTGIESFGYASPPDAINPDEYATTRGRNYLFWNMTDVVKLPVLVAMSAGHAAVRLESTPDTVIVQEALDALRKIYGARNVPAPLETVVTRWSYDEYARGSYSYVATGASGDDYDRLAAPLGNTVYFAGEHTCREYPATVHGALLSGMRAAAEVANAVYGEVKYVEDETVMEVVEPPPDGGVVSADIAEGGGPSGQGMGMVSSLFATLVNGMAGAANGEGVADDPMQVDSVIAPAPKRKRGGPAPHDVASRGLALARDGTLRDLGATESTDDVESGAGSDGTDQVGPRRLKKPKSTAPSSTKKSSGTKTVVSPVSTAPSAPDDPTDWRIKPGRNWTRSNVNIPCTQYMSSDAPCTVTCTTPESFFQHLLTHLPPNDRQKFPAEPDGLGEYPTFPRMYMPIPPKAPTKNPFMLFQLVSWEAMRRETPDNERHLIRQRMGERWRDLDLKTKQVFQAELDRMAEKYARAMDVFRMQCEALGLGEYRTHLEAQVPVDLERLEESLSQVGTPVLQAATLFVSSAVRGSSASRESAASDHGAGGGGITSPSPLARHAGTPPLKPGENPHARRDGLLAAGAAGVVPMPPFSPLPPMAKGSPRVSTSSPRSFEPPLPQPKLQRPVSPSGASRQPTRPVGVHTPGRTIQPRPTSPKVTASMTGGNVIPPIQPSRAAVSASSPKLPGPRSLFPHPATPSSTVATGPSSHFAIPSPGAPSAPHIGSPSSMPASFVLYQATSRLNRLERAGTSPPPAVSAVSVHMPSTHTSPPLAAPPPGVIAPGTIPTTSASHHSGSGSGKPPADGIKTYLNTVVGDRQYQHYVQQRNAAAAAAVGHGSPPSSASSASSSLRSPAPPSSRGGLPPTGNR